MRFLLVRGDVSLLVLIETDFGMSGIFISFGLNAEGIFLTKNESGFVIEKRC
jgi:hypothetical protein